MSDIERKRVTGTARVHGIDYAFDATVFRRVYRDQQGAIDHSAWQVGNYSSLRTAPAIADDSRAELEAEITRRANSPGEAFAADQP